MVQFRNYCSVTKPNAGSAHTLINIIYPPHCSHCFPNAHLSVFSSLTEWQTQYSQVFFIHFRLTTFFIVSCLFWKRGKCRGLLYTKTNYWPSLYKTIKYRRKTETLRNVILCRNPLMYHSIIHSNILVNTFQVASTHILYRWACAHTVDTVGWREHFDKLFIRNVWTGNINCVWIIDWFHMADLLTKQTQTLHFACRVS